MPDIIAVTRDDIQHRFPCAESSFVLDAAEEAGLYLPSVCRHGRCGTCWAQVVSGSYEQAPFEAKALPPDPGGVLLCRCRPRGPLVVQLPCRDAQIGRRHAPERRASIEAVSPADKGWVSLSVRLARAGEFGQAAEFSAGQFVEVQLPGAGLWQPMAMVNLPNDEGMLEFLLRPVAGEALAAWLAGARRGMELQLRGPLGRFALDETSPRPRCLIGAGAGLAPLLAMLRQLADIRDRTRTQVIFEAAKAERVFVERQFATLRAALPQLTLALVTADAAQMLSAQLEKLPEMDIYACAPQEFLTALADVARAHGVPEARLRAEPLAAAKSDPAAELTGT